MRVSGSRTIRARLRWVRTSTSLSHQRSALRRGVGSGGAGRAGVVLGRVLAVMRHLR